MIPENLMEIKSGFLIPMMKPLEKENGEIKTEEKTA